MEIFVSEIAIFISESRAPSRTFRKGTKLEIPTAHARLPQLVACSVAYTRPYAPTYPAGHPYLPCRAPSVRADLPCWAHMYVPRRARMYVPRCSLSVRDDLPCCARMYVPRCSLSVRADLPCCARIYVPRCGLSVRADLPCWPHMYVPRCALTGTSANLSGLAPGKLPLRLVEPVTSGQLPGPWII